MSEFKKVKAKVLDAKYVKEAQSIVFLLECDQGQFRTQIHRDVIATYGNRTEEEIEKELEKYIDILKYAYVGKPQFLNVVFDPDLNEKLKDHYPLKY